MSADTDAVTLAIAGHEHRDWERYSIDSDFFTPADAWSLSLGIPATAIPDYVKPWAEVQVRLGTDVILTGRVDAVRRRLAKGEHRLELHGRDRAGVLLDCSAPVLARRELTLAEICATYLRPLGIDRMDVQGGDSRKKVTVEPGMSAWEALERAAELAGLWPWFTPNGVLKVAAPDYGRAVEVLQQFGFSSGVPEGSDLIVIPLGGRTSASVIIATENAAYRLKVGPGEARMYSQDGAYIHIKQGRVIEVDCDELAINVKNNARLTAGQQVTVEAGSGIVLDTPQTTVTGNMTATGQKGDRVEMTADMTLRGNITQTGSITSSGDHTAGGISLTGHTHTGVQTGGGSTGKPQ